MALETYRDFAENDFFFFTDAYSSGRMGNIMGAMAQGICEKYMKDIIDTYYEPQSARESHSKEKILKTHNLEKLIKFLDSEMDLKFERDTKNAMRIIDGYYFSTRYPGDDSIELTADDIKDCLYAVTKCRDATANMIEQLSQQEIETGILEEAALLEEDYEL